MIGTLDLETKVQELFPGATIKKSLAKFNAQFRQQYPRCVIDYLIAKLGVDPDNPGPGIGKIERLMRDHSVEVGQAELTKSRIRESPKRQHVVFGNVRVRYQDHTDRYLAEVPALDDQNIRVSRHLIEDFGPVLLTSGAWGKYTIAYAPEEKPGRRCSPFEIIRFEPMQITAFSTDYVIERRDAFTADEWIDLLITSLGFDPTHLSAGTKMLYLARLIVLVEPNVNIVELGPPETAKTYTYRLSPYTHIIQGSNTTVPSLFCNNRSHKVGIMGHRDCVIFDEIAHANDKEMDEVFGMLQCYMNDGTFARDNRQYVSECGVVFLGNIPTNRETRAPEGYHRHLFMPLPVAMRKEQDGAFLDRVHGFIPGWQAPQITTNSYATSYGLMAAYLAEFLHQMRRRNYQYIVTERVDFKGMGQRSATAVTRLASGLLKLVYPHRDADTILPEELDWALAEAVKLRQLVLNQLAVIAPGEFAGVKLNYEIQ
jgi:ATP-dependent Lon protease